jgi:class 3 adenylate cyclase/pimeloyl-ACP methyl ester carboxylesterase
MGPVEFVEVGGGWVGYRTIGDVRRRPLLYLPTAGGSNIDTGFEWAPLRDFFDRLARFAGTITFDRRGTGVSDPVPGRIAPTLEDWTEDALAVLDAAGIGQVTLFAHTMATAPALLFAAAHPERVAGLIIVNGFARIESAPGYDTGLPEPVDFVERLVASVAANWGKGSVFLDVNPELKNDPGVREWIARHERNTFGRATAVEAWRAWLSVDARPVVPSVSARALVMQGTRRWSLVGAGRWLAANLPSAQLFEFENVNNDWWYLDGRDVALSRIEEFLTGTRTLAPPERVLATVLVTDIVDSTRRAAAVGDRVWRQKLDEHDRVAAQAVGEYRGRLVKQTGDGVLATFDGPARAVECAQALREALCGLDLPIRAGLHTGEIEVRGEDVSGIAVHLASRISATAGAGEIVVSRTIPDLVVGSGLQFTSRGTAELKGVPGTWELFDVVSAR